MGTHARAYINRIAGAVPDHDVHDTFIAFAERFLSSKRDRMLFRRMCQRADIKHRFSFFEPHDDKRRGDRAGFYREGAFPGTSARMERYAAWAPDLAARAVNALNLSADETPSHLVLASCTGFCAPGVDQLLAERIGLDPGIQRTLVGYMGCSAAVNALRVADYIVRADPEARVLVVNVELCTLHLEETDRLETILSALLFGDGASAALVSGRREGLEIVDFRTATIPGTAELITWHIGDHGFRMELAGAVPGSIARALADERERNDCEGILRGMRPEEVDVWAVHPGGRTVLDAVEQGLGLPAEALGTSRGVLSDYGNMSSTTIMFVLARILAQEAASVEEVRQPRKGFGMAFGPGLVAETFRFATAA